MPHVLSLRGSRHTGVQDWRRGAQLFGQRPVFRQQHGGIGIQRGAVARVPGAAVALQSGLSALDVERLAGVHEFLVRAPAFGVRRQPVQRGGEAAAGGRARFEQVFPAVGRERQRRLHQRLEVVGDVIQRIALGEVHRAAVGADVGGYLGQQPPARVGDQRRIAQYGCGHGQQLDAMALPVVDVVDVGRAGFLPQARAVTRGHAPEQGDGRRAGGGGQGVAGQCVGLEQLVEVGFVDRVEVGPVAAGPGVEVARDLAQQRRPAAQSPGHGGAQGQRPVAFGFGAGVVDTLVRQQALGVQVGHGLRPRIQVRQCGGHHGIVRAGGRWRKQRAPPARGIAGVCRSAGQGEQHGGNEAAGVHRDFSLASASTSPAASRKAPTP